MIQEQKLMNNNNKKTKQRGSIGSKAKDISWRDLKNR